MCARRLIRGGICLVVERCDPSLRRSLRRPAASREVFGILHDRAVQHATETTANGSSVVAAGIERAEAELLLLTVREARRVRFLPLRITARTA